MPRTRNQRSRRTPPRRRLQLEIGPDQEFLDELLASGLISYAQAVRAALRIAAWMVRKQKEGYTLTLTKDAVNTQVEFFW